MANRFYLAPIEQVGNYRGPKYFSWRFDPDPPALIDAGWSMMDYGFLPYALILADVDAGQHSTLSAQADVYAFPENLDQPVTDPAIDAFFEAVNIPTDWLTPSTTYRELLRQTAGMMQFNQRYGGIYTERYGGNHSIFDTATLSTRLRQMSSQEQEIFLATVESFGFDPQLVNVNSQLRLLVRQAGDFWAGMPFYMGGIEF